MIKNSLLCVIILSLFFSVVVSADNICQYSSSATATSENSGSLASYAEGAPTANGNCNDWSGYENTWSPENWNIKANITLNYDTLVYADNFTIFGDYDMCWNKMWLKNSVTQEQRLVFEGIDNNCISVKILAGDFLADTIILESCGWSWSSTDAVEICGSAEV